MNNVSLAFLASIITYIVIQYVPERKRAHNAFVILRSEISKLYSYMSRLIGIYLFEIGVDEKEEQITVQQLSKVCNVMITDKKRDCRIQHQRNGADDNCQSFGYNLFKDSKQYAELIAKCIDRIKEAPCCSQLDFEMLNTISEIENSWFTSFIIHLNNPCSKTPGCQNIIVNYDQGFYEFIQNHVALVKYDFDAITYKFLNASPEEMIAHKEQMLFLTGRLMYKYRGEEISREVAEGIISLEPTEERLNKSQGVLLEMLVYYDSCSEKPRYMLENALSLAKHIWKNETDPLLTKYAFLNYMQVKKRKGSISSDEKEDLKQIMMDTSLPNEILLGAAILCEDYKTASRIFEKMTEEEQAIFIQFPIYQLWRDPPVMPNPEPMGFLSHRMN